MSPRPSSSPSTATPATSAQARPLREGAAMVLDSGALFAGQQTVLIRHQGELYRLQKTRQGKLILTK